MSKLMFVKTSVGQGSRVHGKLIWLNNEYGAISGGYGKGAIPDGFYTIDVYHAAEGTRSTMKLGFIDALTGKGWFLPLVPQFNTTRSGFGIHPDGNSPGTKGCVGLQGKDIKTFWDKWLATAMASRPTTLSVTSNICA